MKTREEMLRLISSLAPSIHYLAIKQVHELAPGIFAVKDNEFTWELVFDSSEYRCGNETFPDIASGIDAPEGLGITEDPTLTWNSTHSVKCGGEMCLVRNDGAPIAWHAEPISIDF